MKIGFLKDYTKPEGAHGAGRAKPDGNDLMACYNEVCFHCFIILKLYLILSYLFCKKMLGNNAVYAYISKRICLLWWGSFLFLIFKKIKKYISNYFKIVVQFGSFSNMAKSIICFTWKYTHTFYCYWFYYNLFKFFFKKMLINK